jgi:hypothetical protein
MLVVTSHFTRERRDSKWRAVSRVPDADERIVELTSGS